MDGQHLRRMVAYLLSFGLGRAALFGAPFLLANFLPSSDYGVLETALAGASVLAGLVTLGVGSAIPLVLLRHNTDASLKGIVTHHLVVVGAALIFLLLGLVLQFPMPWLLTALLTACLAMQGLASTQLKTQGYGDASVLTDSGLLGLMALAAYIANCDGAVAPMAWIWAAALCYCLILVVIYLRIWTQTDHIKEPLAWGGALRLGIPLMLGGLVSLLVTTSGRLGMGLMAGPVLTADYAVLARAAALPIVAHQLILIAKFQNLFAESDDAVESATLHIVLLVGVSVIGFIAFSPWLGLLLGPAFVRAFDLHRVACFGVVVQAVLWSAIALNDLVIARHHVMPRVLPYSVSFLGMELLLGWFSLTLTELTLERFVFTHSAVMLSFYWAQSWVMNNLGLRLRKTWIVTSIIFIVLMGAVYIAG